ncbi:hypothetical protein AVEN_98774-1 [Araneus ventricosus]|uniref:Uncharacterized protein n=1 Tax=Araneus ventricosus TaxID=182803 RepID=A0A4Y2LCT2_ARAVE|nr:hypothetical protein AVEN_98774-1 [Araneus ventricosus]
MINIKSIGRIFGDGVTIITDNESDCEAVKLHLESLADIKENFTIVVATKRKPQIILYNVDQSILSQDLADGLIEKNSFMADANGLPLFRIEFSNPAINKDCRHWVLTVGPEIFREVRKLRGLYLQWSRVRFAEFVGIRQCSTCLIWLHNKEL